MKSEAVTNWTRVHWGLQPAACQVRKYKSLGLPFKAFKESPVWSEPWDPLQESCSGGKYTEKQTFNQQMEEMPWKSSRSNRWRVGGGDVEGESLFRQRKRKATDAKEHLLQNTARFPPFGVNTKEHRNKGRISVCKALDYRNISWTVTRVTQTQVKDACSPFLAGIVLEQTLPRSQNK